MQMFKLPNKLFSVQKNLKIHLKHLKYVSYKKYFNRLDNN